MVKENYLGFEKGIVEIDKQIEELTKLDFVEGINYSEEIRKLDSGCTTSKKACFNRLS